MIAGRSLPDGTVYLACEGMYGVRETNAARGDAAADGVVWAL